MEDGLAPIKTHHRNDERSPLGSTLVDILAVVWSLLARVVCILRCAYFSTKIDVDSLKPVPASHGHVCC
jgi:hypothetical protein